MEIWCNWQFFSKFEDWEKVSLFKSSFKGFNSILKSFADFKVSFQVSKVSLQVFEVCFADLTV